MATLQPGAESRSSKSLSLVRLTPRELEILQLVLKGKSNKAIAGQIDISEKTVEFHLSNIYSKLGVQTRLMAGVWALKQRVSGEPGSPVLEGSIQDETRNDQSVRNA